MHFPKHLQKTEAQIINRILTGALASGCEVEVIEGENGEQMLAPSSNRAAIQKEIATSDITVLRFHRNGEPVGQAELTHGNGANVISDWSWSEDALQLMQTIVREALTFTDRS